MIYEAKITFHKLEVVRFVRSQDVANFKPNVPYEVAISLQPRSISLMNEVNSPIGKLSLQDFYLGTFKEGEEITLYCSKEKGKKDFATIKASKTCIKAIFDEYKKNKQFKSCLAFVPSKIQHISLLSGESASQKYRGFINLAGIMFLVLNIRNIIDNFYHYGVRFQSTPGDFIPLHTIAASASLSVFVFFAFTLEKMKFNEVLGLDASKILLTLNWMMVLVFNLVYCNSYDNVSPIASITFTVLAIILVLKLISFQQVNEELHRIIKKFKQSKKKDKNKELEKALFSQYQISPDNLALIAKFEGQWDSIVSFNKFAYFLFAPTLCYQLQYPRTLSIRKIWLAKRLIQFAFILGLQILLWVQYMEPCLRSLLKAVNEPQSTWLELINRHLRLSVPNTIAWIMGFYSVFHLWFNILGEVLYFGDRNFYKDWWNCKTIEEYWKTWNLPVHFWFLRHVYNPLLERGYSKMTAILIVFFISAVAHEYVVSVPLGIISYYAFLAMLLQAPTIFIQKKLDKILHLENSELGNASFWIFFCFIGQPLVVTVYYSIYMNMHPEVQQAIPI